MCFLPQSHGGVHGKLSANISCVRRTLSAARTTHARTMSSTQSERQIPKSLQGLAKANKATGLLVAYTAAFLTLG